MEEKYEKMNDNTQKIMDGFNEHSRNAGRMTLFVTYTAIPSNREIVREFAEYAYNEANNNYLSAIKQLMDNKKYIERMLELESRMLDIESRMDLLRDYALETMEKLDNGNQEKTDRESTGRQKRKFF